VDEIIDQTLKGSDRVAILQALEELVALQHADVVILGCTELSLFASQLTMNNKLIIDPLDLISRKILSRVFSNKME
jgi:aspartate/glutamate racemase